jgi:divalent metal cation (Fe/Co/Zn/Cd) transporter
VLARASRGLLLGEAANAKEVALIREAIEAHPNCERVIELLTMHLAPKQILINAHVKLREDLVTNDILKSIEEIEERIKRAEPKVEMIFLEAARGDQVDQHRAIPEHIG